MLVCVLSADYFADSNAVFVLESGVQVDLHVTRWDSLSCRFCLTCSEAHHLRLFLHFYFFSYCNLLQFDDRMKITVILKI